ncbi:hypothetical protein E3N88_03279 [Mikania micrantha]|uniref:SHSP domain-containing protein n=1 Tax=Mikania micrantha TaxID=192012 RepID=A0A5N6Q6J3_9ASTR|nr:hypothetical protein E3N88_03279 [Mikania micrantha]
MKPSRYATTPSRKSPRYAKQTGSRDSRISSRYAMKTFDRPSRYAKAMQIKIFIKLNPIHSVRFLHISSDFLLIFSTLNLCQTCSKPLVTLLEVFPSSLASLKTLELGEEARRIEVTIHAPNHHHQKLLLLNLIVKELLSVKSMSFHVTAALCTQPYIAITHQDSVRRQAKMHPTSPSNTIYIKSWVHDKFSFPTYQDANPNEQATQYNRPHSAAKVGRIGDEDYMMGEVSIAIERCSVAIVINEDYMMACIKFIDIKFRRTSVFDPFSLDIWDPFEGFPFNNFHSLSDQVRSSETSSFVNANIDWKETPDAHVFKADVPGLKKEEVKVEVEDDRVLQISGERNKESEDKGDTWHRVERSSGKFVRRFRLPENAKVKEVKAAMENGVLTVTVPKVEVKKPDVKSIQISG